MRIDEQLTSGTAFLSTREETEEGCTFHPQGTAFFIGELLPKGRAINYVVTARHVIDSTMPNGSLWVRCGSSGEQKRTLFELPHDSWWLHPTTDIAVAPLSIPLEDYGLRFLPLGALANTEWIQEHDVGIGDRVIASGLFWQHIGQLGDAPMVRFGRIALVPEEPVRVSAQGPLPSMEFPAILVELGAWNGQSGSPVFVYFSTDCDLFSGQTPRTQIPNPRLLGILSGHHIISQKISSLPGDPDNTPVPVNSGISVVVPATGIFEVLAQDQAVEFRSEFIRILREAKLN